MENNQEVKVEAEVSVEISDSVSTQTVQEQYYAEFSKLLDKDCL